MTVIKTSMRVDTARKVPFSPTFGNPATNVQDAINNTLPALNGTVVSSASSPYTPPPSIGLLLVDTSTGPVSIVVPLSSSRGPLVIKDYTGNAAVNNITVTFSGGERVDGQASVVVSNAFGWVTLAPISGVGWYEN